MAPCVADYLSDGCVQCNARSGCQGAFEACSGWEEPLRRRGDAAEAPAPPPPTSAAAGGGAMGSEDEWLAYFAKFDADGNDVLSRVEIFDGIKGRERPQNRPQDNLTIPRPRETSRRRSHYTPPLTSLFPHTNTHPLHPPCTHTMHTPPYPPRPPPPPTPPHPIKGIGAPISEAQTEQLLEAFDTSGDGHVDRDEFGVGMAQMVPTASPPPASPTIQCFFNSPTHPLFPI